MAFSFDIQEPRCALIAIAQEFYRRGWMPGTAGNISARTADDTSTFWITGSGLPKGSLQAKDFLLMDVAHGKVLERGTPALKPSAESSIHQAIYSCFPQARACLHVHSVDTCLALDRAAANAQTFGLPPLEVIKCFDIWEQQPHVELPLFENWLDVPTIAQEIAQRFAQQTPRLSALGIRHHGITVWGESLQNAFNRVEAMEFIMSYIAHR